MWGLRSALPSLAYISFLRLVVSRWAKKAAYPRALNDTRLLQNKLKNFKDLNRNNDADWRSFPEGNERLEHIFRFCSCTGFFFFKEFGTRGSFRWRREWSALHTTSLGCLITAHFWTLQVVCWDSEPEIDFVEVSLYSLHSGNLFACCSSSWSLKYLRKRCYLNRFAERCKSWIMAKRRNKISSNWDEGLNIYEIWPLGQSSFILF